MNSNYRPDRHSSAQPFFGSASSSSSPYSSSKPSAPPESGNPNLYPSRNEQVGGGAAAAASYVWNNPHLSSAGYCGQQIPQTTGFSGPQSGNPYVQTTPTASRGGAGPIDFLNKLGKQVECIAGNVWGHLKVGNSVSDSALGIINQGSKLLTGGGFEGLYKQIFGLAPNEWLLKTYACYLSTSRGPISGTLYITNQKFAFCSDRPIAYAPTPGQQALSYYKVVLPLEKVCDVAPSETQNKPTEKYILVFMDDGHEFWFTGLVNYDKGLKNMRESILRRGKNSSNPKSGFYPPRGLMSVSTHQGSGVPYQTVYSSQQSSAQNQGWQPTSVPSQAAGQNSALSGQFHFGSQHAKHGVNTQQDNTGLV